MKKALSVFYSNLSIKTKLLFSYVLLFMIPLGLPCARDCRCNPVGI